MKEARMGSGVRAIRTLLPGLGLWVLLAVAAGTYAAVGGRPALPAVVTLDEWVAAVLFIAPLVAFMLNIGRSAAPEDRVANRLATVAGRLGWMALVVFLMALAMRGIFGLGWNPF